MIVFDWANLDAYFKLVEKSWEQSIPQCEAVRIAASPKVGEGYWEYHRWQDELNILLVDVEYFADSQIITTDSDFIRVNFSLLLECSLTDEEGNTAAARPMVWRIINSVPEARILESFPANRRNTYLTAHFSSAFLAKLANVEVDELPTLLQPLGKSATHGLEVDVFEFSSEMLGVLSSAIDPPMDGATRLQFVRAQTKTLLCFVLNELLSSAPRKTSGSLKQADQAKIDEIAKALDADPRFFENYAQICSLYAINKNKLNQGFRDRFGVSLRDYVRNIQYQKAYDYLVNTDLPIGVISERVGIRQQSTLATAMKRKFGKSPLALRKSANQKGRTDKPAR